MPPLPSLSPFIPTLILCHYPLSHVTLCFCSRLLHPPTSFSLERTSKGNIIFMYPLVPTLWFFTTPTPLQIVLPLLPPNRSVFPIFLSASTDLVLLSLLLPLFLSPFALIDKHPFLVGFSSFVFFRYDSFSRTPWSFLWTNSLMTV